MKKKKCPYKTGTFESFAWAVTQAMPEYFRPTNKEMTRSLKQIARAEGRKYNDSIKR
jgi:hypothetical protein